MNGDKTAMLNKRRKVRCCRTYPAMKGVREVSPDKQNVKWVPLCAACQTGRIKLNGKNRNNYMTKYEFTEKLIR